MAKKLRCKHVRLSDITTGNVQSELKKLKTKLLYYIRKRSPLTPHNCQFEKYEAMCQSYEEDIHIICDKFGIREVK